jgi:hypothetical protein
VPAALINALAEAGASCPELEIWRSCEVSRDARCEACTLGGPDRCDARPIVVCVGRLASLGERGACPRACPPPRTCWRGRVKA